jgi:hypothetical protein
MSLVTARATSERPIRSAIGAIVILNDVAAESTQEEKDWRFGSHDIAA